MFRTSTDARIPLSPDEDIQHFSIPIFRYRIVEVSECERFKVLIRTDKKQIRGVGDFLAQTFSNFSQNL